MFWLVLILASIVYGFLYHGTRIRHMRKLIKRIEDANYYINVHKRYPGSQYVEMYSWKISCLERNVNEGYLSPDLSDIIRELEKFIEKHLLKD